MWEAQEEKNNKTRGVGCDPFHTHEVHTRRKISVL